MRIGRAILAFLVALSLAALPMAGAFAVQKDDVAPAEMQMASSHECCDDEGMPAGPAMKECQASAGCVAKCFNVFAAVFSSSSILPPTGGTASPFASDPFVSQTSSPPFRPPRV